MGWMQSIRMVKKTYSRFFRDCQTFIKEKLVKKYVLGVAFLTNETPFL